MATYNTQGYALGMHAPIEIPNRHAMTRAYARKGGRVGLLFAPAEGGIRPVLARNVDIQQ